MALLADTSLTADERLVLERFGEEMRRHLGPRLSAIWLFGSSARGEPRDPEESDVDLLVIVEDAGTQTQKEVYRVLDAAARELGREATAWSFSVHLNTPTWLAQRRRIQSFFIAEVDRDKIVVADTP